MVTGHVWPGIFQALLGQSAMKIAQSQSSTAAVLGLAHDPKLQQAAAAMNAD